MRTALTVIGLSNAIGFTVTALIKSEVFVDLVGTGSIGASALLIYRYGLSSSRSLVATTAIAAWSLRLSVFLAVRAFLDGDKRLQKFLPEKGKSWTGKKLASMAGFWTLQALWGLIYLTPLVLSAPHSAKVPLSAGAWGLGIAAAGFLIEAIADAQKFAHKRNHDGLYTGGLFSIVQYPNYSGEILTWTGLGVYFLASFTSRYGALRYVWSFMPVGFVSVLLVHVSGIAMTERSRKKRYGNDPEYQSYLQEVPKWLVPGIY